MEADNEESEGGFSFDLGEMGPTYIALLLVLGYVIYRYNDQIKGWMEERRSQVAVRASQNASKQRYGRSSAELTPEEMREQMREARLRQQAYVTNATKRDAEARTERKSHETAEKIAKQALANGQEVASSSKKDDDQSNDDKKKKPINPPNNNGAGSRVEFMERLPTLSGGTRDTFRPSYPEGGSSSYRPTGFQRKGGGGG